MLACAPIAVRFSISPETIINSAIAALSWYFPVAAAPTTAKATSAFIPASPLRRSVMAAKASGAPSRTTAIAAGTAA